MVYEKTIKIGNTIINILPPPPISEHEKEMLLDELYDVAWTIVHRLREKGEDV